MKYNYCPPKVLADLKAETLNGKRFYTLENGKKLPSITTVLSAMKREAIQNWRKKVGEEKANAISRKAAGRGTNVHTLCERYLNNESLGDIMPDAKEMFFSIKPLLHRINNIHYQEQTFWSTQLGIAGRVDCIAEFDETLSVIDFKTSRRIKTKNDIEDYFWQTTAYALMYEELIGKPINDIIIIMAVENEAPLLFKEKTENHIDGLVKAIRYYETQNY
jgi:ATP-dependent exoDNAse (exonuclease V) beta subunit